MRWWSVESLLSRLFNGTRQDCDNRGVSETVISAPAGTPDDTTDGSRRREPRLAPFLIAFAAYTGFALAILTLGALAAWASHSSSFHDRLHEWGLRDSAFGRAALGMADASHDTQPAPQLAIDYGFSLFNLALAFFLVWLRPKDPTARRLVIGLVGTAAVFNLQSHSVYEATQVVRWEEIVHDAFHLIAAIAYVIALLRFPDGELIPRWRPWAKALLYLPLGVAVILLALQVDTRNRTLALIMYFGVLTPVAGVLAQAYRYRRSPGAIERQQSRLMFWSLSPALLVSAFVLTQGIQENTGLEFEGRTQVYDLPVELFRVFQPVFALIPVALFVGILRYRLWNIDRVISRTLVYGILAGFVTAVYVGVVVGVGRLVGQQSANDENLLLSIVATGVIAVAFQPVKERVNRFANRLVYGKRATPYEVLSEFSERMGETLATEELLARMARIIAEGTGARQADVWLMVGGEARPAASWPEHDGGPPSAMAVTDGEFPAIAGATAVVPVRHRGELLGALVVTKPGDETLTPTEEKLLADVGAQAGLVLRNVRLTAELVARLEELRASRQRLVAAQDEERRRLERNLHDGAQQQLVALKVQLGLAERAAEAGQPVADLLRQLRDETGEALENLRDLARGIYPPLLAAEGLPSALAGQARKAPFEVHIDADGVGRYPQDIETAVYFCCLEAFQNAAKYAHASDVQVLLRKEDGHLVFSVHDNGQGFDMTCTPTGSGCQNMSDRVEALGGTLDIRSAPGEGTTVSGRIPCPEDPDSPLPTTRPATAVSDLTSI